MTVAIPAGRLIESGDRASSSHSDSRPAEIAKASTETFSRLRRRVAVSASSEEKEEEGMLRQRRPRVVVEDLEALAFGDQALDAPHSAGDAPSPPPSSAAVATTSAPTSPTAIVISDSPAEVSQSAGDQERPAEVLEEGGRPEKRPRIKALSSSPAALSPSEAAPQSPLPDIWRPNLEAVDGRPLTIADRVSNSPFVVAALG